MMAPFTGLVFLVKLPLQANFRAAVSATCAIDQPPAPSLNLSTMRE